MVDSREIGFDKIAETLLKPQMCIIGFRAQDLKFKVLGIRDFRG